MNLVDYETEEAIIDPYITICEPKGNEVAINTSTFGATGQHSLIALVNKKILEQSEERFYRVDATAGILNNELEVEENCGFMGKIFKGYINEDYLKENLPKTFKYFSKFKTHF